LKRTPSLLPFFLLSPSPFFNSASSFTLCLPFSFSVFCDYKKRREKFSFRLSDMAARSQEEEPSQHISLQPRATSATAAVMIEVNDDSSDGSAADEKNTGKNEKRTKEKRTKEKRRAARQGKEGEAAHLAGVAVAAQREKKTAQAATVSQEGNHVTRALWKRGETDGPFLSLTRPCLPLMFGLKLLAHVFASIHVSRCRTCGVIERKKRENGRSDLSFKPFCLSVLYTPLSSVDVRP
jgi:hypothetical protein